MIEAGRNPSHSVVANVALLREARGHVIRAGGCLEILEVTSYTGGAGQLVVIVDMALSALYGGMESGERPARTRVIESGAEP